MFLCFISLLIGKEVTYSSVASPKIWGVYRAGFKETEAPGKIVNARPLNA